MLSLTDVVVDDDLLPMRGDWHRLQCDDIGMEEHDDDDEEEEEDEKDDSDC
jgi:hypothetical protein